MAKYLINVSVRWEEQYEIVAENEEDAITEAFERATMDFDWDWNSEVYVQDVIEDSAEEG